jgi:glycopeptide antibiotics resistance protein
MRYYNTLIEAVAGLLPILLILALYYFATSRKNKQSLLHVIGMGMFCFALTAIFSATSIPDIYHLTVDVTVNFIPFADITTNFLQYMLNVILFIPVGFLLPMLWEKFENKRLTFIFGFLITLFIEVSQLFSFRTTDIDDLLMNTLGVVTGYFLFAFAQKIFSKIIIFRFEYGKHWRKEPSACLCLVLLTMFFIQPLISSWLWGLIGGS